MKVKSIVTKIDELRKIVSGWSDEGAGGRPAAIEMDMAISRVKDIYEMLKFADVELSETVAEPVAEVEQNIVEVSAVAEVEVEVEVEEKEVEVEEQETPVIISESEPQLDSESESHSESESEDEIEVESEDEPEDEVESEPEDEDGSDPEPESEPEPATPNSLLLDTLTLNDRLLLSNELFGGDTDKMEQLMLELGAISTLNEALIYIAQRYKWRGDNEGAKLLFSLLKNRYL